MSEFPDAIDAYWHESFLTGDLLFSSETLTVTVNPDLAADRRLMLLETHPQLVSMFVSMCEAQVTASD